MIASLYRLSAPGPDLRRRCIVQTLDGRACAMRKGVFAPYRGVKKTLRLRLRAHPAAGPDLPARNRFRAADDGGRLHDHHRCGRRHHGRRAGGRGRGKKFRPQYSPAVRAIPKRRSSATIPSWSPSAISFTRKLTFLREANAVAAFPGGFGTLDEALELITLMQTGKARLIPARPGRPTGRHVLEIVHPIT